MIFCIRVIARNAGARTSRSSRVSKCRARLRRGASSLRASAALGRSTFHSIRTLMTNGQLSKDSFLATLLWSGVARVVVPQPQHEGVQDLLAERA